MPFNQGVDVLCQIFGRDALALEQPDLALGIEHIKPGGVIHGVAARRLARYFFVIDLEVFRRQSDLRGRAGKRQESRVEMSDVGLEDFRRVTLGVDGNEQKLHIAGFLAQIVHGLRHYLHRCRADVGALGIAEVHHHHLAGKVSQGSRLAIEIGQRKAVGIRHPGDVHAVKHIGLAAGRQHQRGKGRKSGRQNQRATCGRKAGGHQTSVQTKWKCR